MRAPRAICRGRAPRCRRVAWIATVLVAWLLALPAWAHFTPPAIQGHVTDLAGKLTAAERGAIEQKLTAVDSSTGNEIAVVLLPSMDGSSIEDVAYETFNTWHLGKKGADNGVLLVVAVAERRVRIETGKGVEGRLTDVQTQDIIQNHVVPSLRADHYGEAMEQGTDAIAAVLAGHPLAAPRQSILPAFLAFGAPVLVFGLIFTLFAVLSIRRTRRLGGVAGQFGGGYYPGGRGWSDGGGGSPGGGGFSGGGGESGGGGSSAGF